MLLLLMKASIQDILIYIHGDETNRDNTVHDTKKNFINTIIHSSDVYQAVLTTSELYRISPERIEKCNSHH